MFVLPEAICCLLLAIFYCAACVLQCRALLVPLPRIIWLQIVYCIAKSEIRRCSRACESSPKPTVQTRKTRCIGEKERQQHEPKPKKKITPCKRVTPNNVRKQSELCAVVKRQQSSHHALHSSCRVGSPRHLWSLFSGEMTIRQPSRAAQWLSCWQSAPSLRPAQTQGSPLGASRPPPPPPQ